MGVRLQNQRTGFLAQEGKTKRQKSMSADTKASRFVLEHLEEAIKLYEKQKSEYSNLFEALCRKSSMLKNLCSIPGIAEISAVKIWATMIEPRRFKTANKYLAYCGLVNYKKESGGRVYGARRPRFSRVLKTVYKTATIVVINGQNPLRSYYNGLIEKGQSEHNARHAVARQIAKISYGVAKTGTKYQAKQT
jgi:transposase